MAPMVSALAVMRSLIARGLKMQHSRAGGKDAPVHGVGEGLFLREAEARARRRQRRPSAGRRATAARAKAQRDVATVVRVFTVRQGSLKFDSLWAETLNVAHARLHPRPAEGRTG